MSDEAETEVSKEYPKMVYDKPFGKGTVVKNKDEEDKLSGNSKPSKASKASDPTIDPTKTPGWGAPPQS